jgi:Tfp pilus assembly protein PilX
MISLTDRVATRARSQAGFTMIVTLGVMLVSSLLLVTAFTAANGDIHLSHEDATQKQAYYAALAGVQEYEYKLQANPDYWQTCTEPEVNLPNEEAGEHYKITLLPASTAPKGTTKCSTEKTFSTMIESSGSLVNTFRIKSTGYAKANGYTASAERSVVATFQVTGFLNFIYYTNFETFDPNTGFSPKACAGKYHKEWSKEGLECATIIFTSGDKVEGPFHTNDAARVEGSASFGREGHFPADEVEINGGTYPSASCTGEAKYYTATKCYTAGPVLIPPEGDTSLGSYVESGYKFSGVTHLVLNGAGGTINATYYKYESKTKEFKEVKETLSWPKNGLIYVQANSEVGCGYKYEITNSDTPEEATEERGCGTVYVEGTYSKALTVAGENDLIIHGSIYPTSVEGSLGSEPAGTPTLGLIASNYVRVYHPCSSGKNGAGSLTNPWIYAGILSTSHSFLNDNYDCGEELGKLHIYGALAQDYRGPVGTTGGTGYLKDYKYDGRLATDEPPYFLAPLKAGWKVIRETAPTGG